ncbi:ABC transporter permease subunit (plasmid) [Neorhizobium galegae]|nr:ABC transporter permease subunit [Neorhizobium galegae]
MALFGLYLFGPSVGNLVIVLAVTRMPAYIRVARAETLEVRERLFVDAARVFGGGPTWILRTHILPQRRTHHADARLGQSRHGHVVRIRPELSRPRHPAAFGKLGLMVAQGQGYLSSAWWLGFFPGLAVMLTTMSFNLLANWFRIVNDPSQHWRLVSRRR